MGGRGAAEEAHRPFVRMVKVENLAAMARHRGLVRLVLQNRATPKDDLGLEFYISSSRFRPARGRGHLEPALRGGSHSCGLPTSFDEAAWTTIITNGPA